MARPKGGGKVPTRGQEAGVPPPSAPSQEGWISLRTGLWLITLISTGLGLFVGWQMRSAGQVGTALVWSLLAAASIWVVFGGALWLGRRLRRFR